MSVDKKSFTKPFFDKQKLAEMLDKLRNKESIPSIARFYNVDPSTISWHKKKHGIVGGMRAGRHKLPPKPPKPPKKPQVFVRDRKFYPLEDELLGDKINVGKSYIDYVKESAERGEQTAIHTLTKGFLSKGI